VNPYQTMKDKPTRIYLSSPHMGRKELEYINRVFESNWIAPLGPEVNGFEKDLAAYTGVKHVAALSSGTAAIHLALIILGVEQDDEVLCSSFTFSGSVNPVLYQKAVPVFIDSEKDTWNMDPGLLEEAIKDRIARGKKPRALILVHLYGMPAKLEELLSLAEQYEIPVIEDAAEALGSSYDGRKLGSFGLMGILSFNGNKIITTSGGGALLSDNPEYVEKARFLATQARDPAPHYQHSHVGYNYRMSNVLAAIGRGQLEVIGDRLEKRREMNRFYRLLLGKIPGIEFLTEPAGRFFSNHWLTSITINPEKTDGITREKVRQHLEKENIETRPLWKPMHLQPVFKDYPAYVNGTSEKLFRNGLCLPSGSNLSSSDKERIVEALTGVFPVH